MILAKVVDYIMKVGVLESAETFLLEFGKQYGIGNWKDDLETSDSSESTFLRMMS